MVLCRYWRLDLQTRSQALLQGLYSSGSDGVSLIPPCIHSVRSYGLDFCTNGVVKAIHSVRWEEERNRLFCCPHSLKITYACFVHSWLRQRIIFAKSSARLKCRTHNLSWRSIMLSPSLKPSSKDETTELTQRKSPYAFPVTSRIRPSASAGRPCGHTRARIGTRRRI